MSDGTGLAEVLSGLPGFRVLDVVETDSEVVVAVETTAVGGVLRGARLGGAGVDAYITRLGTCTVLSDPSEPGRWSRDPDDDYLVALALAADADVLVSGDRDLLHLIDPPPANAHPA